MLITPRTYQQLQKFEYEHKRRTGYDNFPAIGWRVSPDSLRRAQEMLLVHQLGSVKVGEVVRYTLTYTPSLDRIVPSPSLFHVKVRNTSAIPLRAAYLHGPYALYAACYPSTFDPNYKNESLGHDEEPDFEPNLKAGGSWDSYLTVPENVREKSGRTNTSRAPESSVSSCTWIVEISSQVIFSTSATVHFELLIGRDQKSVELGISGLTGQTAARPGQLQDHQQRLRGKDRHARANTEGVYSKALKLEADDTESLWDKPAFPDWSDGEISEEESLQSKPGENSCSITTHIRGSIKDRHDLSEKRPGKKRKRVHLVILTHGLHSNIGSDMLYIKERIDVAAKQARLNSQKRKELKKSTSSDIADQSRREEPSGAKANFQVGEITDSRNSLGLEADLDYDDDEHVMVRGFSGNVVRTERGIQYLGKRLAKYVLEMTYPDQPYLPIKKSVSKSLKRTFTGQQPQDVQAGLPAHLHSSIHRGSRNPDSKAYKITSISFIAHSLGGLCQTYAIAYIQKHSPRFFQDIKPINFVAMASPFLGLSNENPLYVKFALDFGLVGRTGQDLGLSWRPPAMVRSGWDAMIGGIGSEGQKALRHPDPSSKPLIRILPIGPAHQVLKMFRNRTVYSNVVNDGIVPLRTSCLLFLDWGGLDRVEKARRENGIVGTITEWGWAELTGANSSSHRKRRQTADDDARSQASRSSVETKSASEQEEDVPQPSENAVKEDQGIRESNTPQEYRFVGDQGGRLHDETLHATKPQNTSPQASNSIRGLFSFLRPNSQKVGNRQRSPKQTKIYTRSQTLNPDTSDGGNGSPSNSSENGSTSKLGLSGIRGDSIREGHGNIFTPPRTSFFESAGDILSPPLPSKDFIMNPENRPRTIFHDRVYHPEDIPDLPARKRAVLTRSSSRESQSGASRSDTDNSNKDCTKRGMKAEEKIARAYHHDMSWRKVLVRLEPDAHNNICVRRMFANAYGWPVIKHLVDTHFSDSFVANTADEDEPNEERAKPMSEGVGMDGEEVNFIPHGIEFRRTDSETYEAKDSISDLNPVQDVGKSVTCRPRLTHQESALWNDALFDVTDDESETGDTSTQQSIEIPANQVGGSDSPKRASISNTESNQEHPHSPATATKRKLDAGDLRVGPDDNDVNIVNEDKKEPTLVIRGGTTNIDLGKSIEEQLNKIAGIGNRADEDDEGVASNGH